HYKNLLQPNLLLPAEQILCDEVDRFINDEHTVELFDAEISITECEKALKKLSTGKAPGVDQMPYEFIKAGGPILIPYLTKIFNQILHSGIYPKEWALAIICSIFKSGDKNDPNNYRGISLLPSLSKLFDTILETRIRAWENSNSILDQNQAGFRAKYSTVDHIFTLNSIIQRYRSQRRKVYCAFIDFSKAFDCVNRVVLFYKLSREGVSSKFLKLIRSLYSHTKACVKGQETQFFDILAGVQQGAPLSPSFFALILNDLDKELRSNNTGYVTLQKFKIYSLLFADDLVLFAESPKKLLHSLAVLYDYTQKWGFKINSSKSNIMIFRNSGSFTDNTVWKLGRSGQLLQVVDQYKYLGVWF
ncbi:MAG TPA: reverse transcriptase family protein, partial [Ignavibacteriaceae bacterium]